MNAARLKPIALRSGDQTRGTEMRVSMWVVERDGKGMERECWKPGALVDVYCIYPCITNYRSGGVSDGLNA
jgi:hypothetical protein